MLLSCCFLLLWGRQDSSSPDRPSSSFQPLSTDSHKAIFKVKEELRQSVWWYSENCLPSFLSLFLLCSSQAFSKLSHWKAGVHSPPRSLCLYVVREDDHSIGSLFSGGTFWGILRSFLKKASSVSILSFLIRWIFFSHLLHSWNSDTFPALLHFLFLKEAQK